jgi:dihydroorotate dehydrogenase electron transfer subunit
MASLCADARCRTAEVVAHTPCGPDAFILELAFDGPVDGVAPGRFAMLGRDDDVGPLIPRPFSVYDQPAPDRLTFLIQVIGEGTRALARLGAGERVLCTVPLGNGFEVDGNEREVVFLAGGVGSAPFLLYGRQRLEAGLGDRTTFFFGARSADRLYDQSAFEALGLRTVFATDDGSQGFHGTVVACLAAALEKGEVGRDALFAACGPEGLLHAFAAFARAEGLDGRLSLETYMGCGIGVCNACPTPTLAGGPLGNWPYAKTCLEGPVFALDAIAF